MFRSHTRFEYPIFLTIAFLLLTSSTAAASSQPDNAAFATCQAQQPTETDPKAAQSQADQNATEEEDNDFFRWLNDAFAPSAGGQTAKPSQRTGNDRDHDSGHGGGHGGGGGGDGGH